MSASPLTALWEAIGRLGDLTVVSSSRLANLEDRVARLDGGADSHACKREAVSSVSVDLVAAGREPLSCVVNEAGKIVWPRNQSARQ